MNRRNITTERVGLFGLAGGVGGALFALYAIPDLVDPGTFSGSGRTAFVYGAFLVVPLALMLIGLVGLHARLRAETGRLERAGYALSLFGFGVALLAELYGYGVAGGEFDLLGIGDGYFVVFVLSLFVVLAGSALVGVAGWRAGVEPRPGFALFAASVLGVPLLFVLSETAIGTPFVALTVPYGTAWALIGFHLWSEAPRDQSKTATEPAVERK